MKIDEIKISYPFMKYSVVAAHDTPRIPTAMEWLVLEVIKTCENVKEYHTLSMGDLFEKIFFIADSDKLIKPCLISLRDMDIIKVTNLYDELSLKDIYLSEIKLTENGRKLMDSGFLPTEIAYNSFMVFYDVYKNELVEVDRKLPKGEGSGFMVGSLEAFAQRKHLFPSGLVLDLLNQMKNTSAKNRDIFDWLSPSTRISDLRPGSSEEYYRTEKHDIEIVDDGRFVITDLEDQDIVGGVGNSYFENAIVTDDLEEVLICNWDEDLKEVFPLEKISEKINYNKNNQDIIIVNRDYASVLTGGNKASSMLRTHIIDNSDNDEIFFKNNILTIRLQDQILQSNLVYQDKFTSIAKGKFKIHFGEESKYIGLGFVANHKSYDILDKLVAIVDENYKKTPYVLLLLVQLMQIEKYIGYVRNILDEIEDLPKQVDFIENFNKLTQQSYKTKYIGNDIISEYLVQKVMDRYTGKNIKDACAFLEEKNKLNCYTKNDEIYKGLISSLLPRIKDVPSYKDIQVLWKLIKDVNNSYFQYVYKNKLYCSLYGPSTFADYVKCYEEDNFAKQMRNPMPIDEIFSKLQAAGRILTNTMPETLENTELNDEFACKLLAKNYRGIDGIRNNLINWDRALTDLREYGFNIMEYGGSLVYNLNSCFTSLNKNIRLFYDDRVDKYKRIYVVDTSALMNHPEILDAFVDNTSMLIIPKTDLEELDDNKQSEDDEKAYKARKAINQIAKFRDCEWLDLTEEFNANLLPEELDSTNKDNRIISIAIRHYVKRPVFISDDTNACNKAVSLKLSCVDSTTFLKQNGNKVRQFEHNKPNGKQEKPKEEIKSFEQVNVDGGESISISDEKTKTSISSVELAKELGCSLFDLLQFCGKKYGKITKKTTISNKVANRIRKDYLK